ncbi:TraB/GumN family protein [Sphingopyxis jiangsuensis]|uniref:TraB/GumN family protein n=1 Tax=Sphingopyxis jiangsuensis TaxID=2871171 RepID=UPI001F413733|nr:TraB/GumN family protein [Sphingopyxis lutea]
MICSGRPRTLHGRRRVAAILLPLLLAACGTREPGPTATPALWLVADEDTQIYLLGTMHALPRGTDWRGGKVDTAIANADELVLELSPGEAAQAGSAFRALAPRTAPLAMHERLPPAALAGYRALEASGDPFGGDALDDWAVLVLMGQRAARNAALSSSDGVETGLTAMFEAAGKPISGFETARAQLYLFETLDPATQRTLLVNAASDAKDAVNDVRKLTAAWSRADVAALEAIVNDDIDAVPDARKAIITDRNQAWSAWIKRRLDRPGTVLVAVGAGHMVGTDGLPALMEAAGFDVCRVQ